MKRGEGRREREQRGTRKGRDGGRVLASRAVVGGGGVVGVVHLAVLGDLVLPGCRSWGVSDGGVHLEVHGDLMLALCGPSCPGGWW
jgi:hypothetical protein